LPRNFHFSWPARDKFGMMFTQNTVVSVS